MEKNQEANSESCKNRQILRGDAQLLGTETAQGKVMLVCAVVVAAAADQQFAGQSLLYEEFPVRCFIAGVMAFQSPDALGCEIVPLCLKLFLIQPLFAFTA